LTVSLQLTSEDKVEQFVEVCHADEVRNRFLSVLWT